MTYLSHAQITQICYGIALFPPWLFQTVLPKRKITLVLYTSSMSLVLLISPKFFSANMLLSALCF